jgi:hypothetical protein
VSWRILRSSVKQSFWSLTFEDGQPTAATLNVAYEYARAARPGMAPRLSEQCLVAANEPEPASNARRRVKDALGKMSRQRPLVSASNDPALRCVHFVGGVAFSRDLARNTRLRELLSHAAQARMTALT